MTDRGAELATDDEAVPDLLLLGQCRGYELIFNPLNQRIICERPSDLATLLVDAVTYDIVRNWGTPPDDAKALVHRLRLIMQRLD